MNDFLPSPESLTRSAPATEEAPPVVHSADGLPLSLATAQNLQAYMEQQLEAMRAEHSQQINQAIMTIVPEVIELHQARSGAMVHAPQAPQLGQAQRDPIAAILAGGFVMLGLAALGGMGWSTMQAPNAATQRANQELMQQMQQQGQQLIQSNEQLQQSKERCPRVAVFAHCNIGE
jgi:hypothetical protein